MQCEQIQLHAEVETHHWWFTARRAIVHRLLHQVIAPGTPPLPLVIDVGCGTGANLAQLAHDYRCLGIDTSADAVNLARLRFPGVDFQQGFAPQDLGAATAQASAWLLMDVLEHVPDDFLLLSQLLAAASPGAHFLVTVPADLRLWSRHDESFGHYRRYDRQRFTRLWEGLPVTTRLVSHFNTRLFPVVRTVRAVNRWRGETLGTSGTDFQMPPWVLNELLRSWFAGESRRLVRALDGHGPGYSHGVSLVAVLRREAGELEPRTKPIDLPADRYDPRPIS